MNKRVSVSSKIAKLEKLRKEKGLSAAKYLIMDIATYAEFSEELFDINKNEIFIPETDDSYDDDIPNVVSELTRYEGDNNVYIIATVQEIDFEILELR